MNLLFWNVGRKSVDLHLQRMAARHRLDVVLLAEYDPLSDADATAQALSQGEPFRRIEASLCRKIVAFFGQSVADVAPRSEGDRYFIFQVHVGQSGADDLLLSALHLPASIGEDVSDTIAEASAMASILHEQMEKVGHHRVIVAGDFNLDPYSPGMCRHQSFNALMVRRQAGASTRKHHGREYPVLYNPMWGLFGDSTPGPPGTFRSRRSDAWEWHILDQVLVGCDLLPRLGADGVSRH